MWPLIWLWKMLLSFCGKITSRSSEPWPSSWVTKEPTLKGTSPESFVSLCAIQEVRTLPYHAQTNGQVEWAHQMLMHMIGKLGREQKGDWLKHLCTLVHAYNSTTLAITRYSLHYLMSGFWPCLPVTFYFPMIWGTRETPVCWSLCHQVMWMVVGNL